MPPVVLVTDGDQRSSLAVVRCLGRAGYRVEVTSQDGRSLAGGSRWASAEHRTSSPLKDPAGFAADLERICRTAEVTLLLPVTEASQLALLDAPWARGLLPPPTLAMVREVCDKSAVLAAASSCGIAVPRQVVLTAPVISPAQSQSLEYPLVLKPHRSVSLGGERHKTSVRHVATPAGLPAALSAFPAAVFPVLAQQRISGPGVGVFLLIWNDQVKAQFSHRRLREKPPSGGVSVYRESIALDPALLARSRELLRHFQWSGVAMIEYKVEARTGIPYLMEINGRFWGSLQLAIDSGVPFPLLLAQLALGQDPAPVLDYRIGNRSRWWWGDVDHTIARIRHDAAALGLEAGAPSRGRVLLDFLRWRRGDRCEVLRLSDPGPFLRESARWMQRK